MTRLGLGRLLASTTALLALGASAACSAPGGSSSSTADTSGPIKIAVVDAQSGQLSSLGAWEYKGAKLAVDQWNAKGGVNGRQIQLDVFDDTGDPTVGTNLARKIASEGYVAMIGTAESAVTVAMAPVLQQSKIPSITSGQSPSITAVKSPFQFLNGPTSTTYDETLAKYLVDQKGLKSIAFISNNGSYGKGEHDAFGKALADRGVRPVDDQVVTTDQKDFSAALTSIRQKNPQVLFVGTEEVEAGLIVKQARELGLTATVAGAAPMGTTVYLSTAGAQNAEGTVVSSPYLSNDANDASRAFAQAYKAAYNEDAELHGAKAYDGTSIFLTALKNSNGATGQQLADAIRATKYAGLLGSFDFDQTGVGIHATSIGVITGGKLVAASAG
ncbi:branched-chain amino acid transport system substrate-binding protein [Amycolatopsis bartoniae]|uniref:ABC transporter substrate-binding protein n=1 Tax=Amycolatopsis bartoniae TaxID=941986 RepID=A0A8H9M9L1_9PSEU|nr:ABC transporter substrate-binding protein [Amycolatopsis bartoniae]MBB2937954.1 branched-chain amino acid transport system substrate-binding protein [Amycolatopsis bartoniae]TVT08558.1 ABC transporter substrate-binding protein [Amycolatopsis bartoniae]GHF41940.1 ABC transporter substrate-binding protein [Amycolatopsis bartoniae]